MAESRNPRWEKEPWSTTVPSGNIQCRDCIFRLRPSLLTAKVLTGLHTEIAKYMSTLMPSRMRCYGRVIIARITPKNRGAIMNDKLKSAVYGLAVGDALGVPVEFMKRGSFHVTGMTGYGSHNQPAGTWSDDTSMTLATCDSIRVLGRVDCDDIRNRFRQWLYNAEYTVDNVVFDVGNTTARALRCGKGEDSEYSNGNGSLMRILPLAFTNAEDELIGEVSAITHAHTLSKSICIKYVGLARALLNGMPLKDALTDLGKETAALAELTEFEIKSSGYVVDTFRAALWSLATTDNYKDAVLKAVNLGDDTDTVGAVTGGLAGIVYGTDGIPGEWIDMLRGKEIIDRCLF